MSRPVKLSVLTALAGLVLALAPIPATAQVCAPLDDGRVADVFIQGTTLFWEPIIEYREMVLTISGPCEDIVRVFEKGQQITFDVREITKVADGTYTWQLRRAANIDPAVQENLLEARGSGKEDAIWWNYFQKGAIPEGPYVESGTFTVERGVIVDPGQQEEGAKRASIGSKAAGSLAAAVPGGEAGGNPIGARDQVIPDDLIVQGSACIGFDCVNNESFSFDTIRLKENNLRIKFEDTSSAAGFPTNDWQLTANDSASGGASKFSIEDISGAKVPFTIRAGAATNSIFVDSTGRVGLRTATPVLDLHISTTNTPGMRLEQTSGGGFTAQTWDIAGNEANFFIRDVTGGSRLPFRIRPQAPTSSIDISNDGDVGIGTASPDDRLDVEVGTSNGGVTITSATDGNLPQLTLIEPTRTWRFRVANNGNFVFTDATAGSSPVQLVGAANNNLLVVGGTNTVAADADRVTVNGELFIGTSMVTPDYVFEPDFELESIEEHAEYMWTHKHLPAVGGAKVSGDQHLIDVGATQFGMLEELEKAHVYIDQLHQRLSAKEDRVSDLETEMAELKALIAGLALDAPK